MYNRCVTLPDSFFNMRGGGEPLYCLTTNILCSLPVNRVVWEQHCTV